MQQRKNPQPIALFNKDYDESSRRICEVMKDKLPVMYRKPPKEKDAYDYMMSHGAKGR